MKVLSMLSASIIVFVSIPSFAPAEVITDGTTGSVQSLSGNMSILESYGTKSGDNLFHSFKTFNVKTGESATFKRSNANLQNVISRVTGGSLSTINGLLKSEIPNFYFINPAGVTFGANASVDVPSDFHVSTADRVLFGTNQSGPFFSADLNASSSFSSADPVGFGFLGNQLGNIRIEGSNLVFKDKSKISFSAGDLVIDGAGLSDPVGNVHKLI